MPLKPGYKKVKGDGGHWNKAGNLYIYPDGTTATAIEISNAPGTDAGGYPLAGSDQEGGVPPDDQGAPVTAAEGVTDTNNVIVDRPPVVDAPGSTLDTANADADRLQLGSTLARLQQQAATGGGAWEGALADATQRATSAATAIGQSQPGVGYASALRNIRNAKAGAEQRAAGQGNILREQSKMDAQDQLSEMLAAQGNQDVQQATAASDARHGERALGAQRHAQTQKEIAQANANTQKTIDTAVNTATALLSDGGRVPGKAPVFGDDSRNDIVPAKLSPGEIVIPRSHASSPEDAANFVRALKSKGEHHMADGGEVPGWTPGGDPLKPGWDLFKGNNNEVMAQASKERMAASAGPQETPSIKNGGLLDPTQFNENRAATLANQQVLEERAGGRGPSVAPQQMQNATDASIAGAMQAGNRVGAGNALMQATGGLQDAAGGAGVTAAKEQAEGTRGAGKSALGMRGRDQAMSMAQQQAAWRNTLLNSGIGLEQQALMNQIANANSERTRNYVSGGAQALAGYAAATGNDRDSYNLNDSNTADFDQGFGEGGDSGGSDPSEWENPYWTGGEVKTDDTRGADFVRALKRGRAR